LKASNVHANGLWLKKQSFFGSPEYKVDEVLEIEFKERPMTIECHLIESGVEVTLDVETSTNADQLLALLRQRGSLPSDSKASAFVLWHGPRGTTSERGLISISS
jgi:hypothetical protein